MSRCPSYDLQPLLHKAVQDNHLDAAETLLKNHEDPNACGPHTLYMSPLQIAVLRMRHEAAILLLRYGANPNCVVLVKKRKGKARGSSLQKAHDKQQQLLQCNTNATPLVLAIEMHDAKMADILMAAGADPFFAPTPRFTRAVDVAFKPLYHLTPSPREEMERIRYAIFARYFAWCSAADRAFLHAQNTARHMLGCVAVQLLFDSTNASPPFHPPSLQFEMLHVVYWQLSGRGDFGRVLVQASSRWVGLWHNCLRMWRCAGLPITSRDFTMMAIHILCPCDSQYCRSDIAKVRNVESLMLSAEQTAETLSTIVTNPLGWAVLVERIFAPIDVDEAELAQREFAHAQNVLLSALWTASKRFIFALCVGLHSLDLPALLLLAIFDEFHPLCPLLKMHTKWCAITTIKHARDNGGMLTHRHNNE